MAVVHIRKNATRDEIGACLLIMATKPEDDVLRWCATCGHYVLVEGALDAQGIYERCECCGRRFD